MAITQKLNIARVYKDIDMSFTKNSLSGDINKKLDVNAVALNLGLDREQDEIKKFT